MNTIGNRTGRAASIAALSTAAVLSFAGVAHADNIQDTLVDGSTGLTLVAGSGTAGSTGIKLVANNGAGDPINGCNATEANPLVVEFNGLPAGVTVENSADGTTVASNRLKISDCGVNYGVSFTANTDAQGSGTVNVAYVSGPGGASAYKYQVDIPITITQPAPPPPAADTENPTITYTLAPSAPNGAGWYKEDVTVEFHCKDSGGSGLANCTEKTVLGEGRGQSVTGTATDNAGNRAEITTDPVINIDKTAPTGIKFTGGPADKSEHYYGDVPAGPTGCEATDPLSGMASCEVTGGGTAVGSHSYTATATDAAGNTSTVALPYTVKPFETKGFFNPVDMNGVWNTVKGGSTVPMKFEVFAGTAEKTDTAVVKSFTSKAVTCPGSSALVDEIELTTTGGTALRYDSTGGQFIQNWQTPKKPGTCAQTTVTTQDGSTITANFMFK